MSTNTRFSDEFDVHGGELFTVANPRADKNPWQSDMCSLPPMVRSGVPAR